MSGRELKFRAWHNEEKVMGDVDVLTKEGAFVLGVQPGEDTHYPGLTVLAPSKGRFCKKDEIELMQFTGLTDKNNVEIYEGDICLIEDGGESFPEDYNEETDEWEPTGKYIIYWSDDSACYWIKELDGKYSEIEFNPFGYATFEVIGNIHQNPELING